MALCSSIVRLIRSGARWIFLVVGCYGYFLPGAGASSLDDIGYTDLVSQLGGLTPDGTGISVSQIEASDNSGNYRPNQNDSRLTGKSLVAKSGGSSLSSSHANLVGVLLYGNTGIGSGISDVHIWQADKWLANGFLKKNTSVAPVTETQRIQNHSWIDSSSDVGALRRLDYVINRDNVLVVVGQNNGNSTTLPRLLGQSYNILSVGRSDGYHTHGFTTEDGAGRVKPEIVTPQSATSWAVPMVSASAALLLETAIDEGYGDAEENETIRALIMAGATKMEFLGDWDRTTTRPLDDHYGAGELNIFRSHQILTSGQQVASDVMDAPLLGWDFRETTSDNQYFFEVPADKVMAELSAVLVWNRIVTDTPGSGFYPQPQTLDNLNLKLHSAQGFMLDAELDASLSPVDNIEHIYLNALGNGNLLGPGRYALEVVSPTDGVDYSLAWFGELAEFHSWVSTDAVADWDLATNWTSAGIPNDQWVVEIDNMHVAEGQHVVLSADSSIYSVKLEGTVGNLTLEIPTGVTLSVKTGIRVGSDAVIQGGGVIDGFLTNGGTHAVGSSDTLAVTGHVDVSDADMCLEDSYQQVRGTTTGMFSLLTAGSIAGTFATPALAGTASHLGDGRFLWDVAYSETDVEVDILAAIAGDVDGDADIDITDFNHLSTHFDPEGSQPDNDWTRGDFNDDARVDITDFHLLAVNFGADEYAITMPLGNSLLAAVPEPTSWYLLAWGLLVVALCSACWRW